MTQLANFLRYAEQYKAPAVGMPATLVLWTDRNVHEITRVSASGKTFWMKRCATKWENGEHVVAGPPAESEPEVTVRLGSKHGWKAGGCKVLVGVADEHYDKSF